jgi:hypothetical protein
MQIIVDVDEAWSLMTVIVSQVIDNTNLSGDGRAAARKWRSDRAVGTAEMADLTIAINEALGSVLNEKTYRLIRSKGYYKTSKDV